MSLSFLRYVVEDAFDVFRLVYTLDSIDVDDRCFEAFKMLELVVVETAHDGA